MKKLIKKSGGGTIPVKPILNPNSSDIKLLPGILNLKDQQLKDTANKLRLQKEDAIKDAKRPTISQAKKRTPEDEDKRRILNQYYANDNGGYLDDNNNYVPGILNNAADSRFANRAWDNVVVPLTEAEMLMSGAGLVNKGIQAGIKKLTNRAVLSKPQIIRSAIEYPYPNQNSNFDIKGYINQLKDRNFANLPEELLPYQTELSQLKPSEEILNKFFPNMYKPTEKVTKSINPNFKSEIDWSKWNKEIPKNKELLKEYNLIEQAHKDFGTWMKNSDGSMFEGTTEQFVQQHSENFKKAFSDGYDITYRGDNRHYPELRPEDHEFYGKPIFTANKELANGYALNGEYSFYNSNIPTADENIIKHLKPGKTIEEFKKNNPYLANMISTTNEGGVHKLAIPKTSNKIELDAKGKSWDRIMNSKMRSDILNYDIKLQDPVAITTDELAQYIDKAGIDRALINNVDDGGLGNVLIHNQKKGNYAKSLFGNNGMFDMTNPNIYKVAIPSLVGTKILEQTMNNKPQMGDGGINYSIVDYLDSKGMAFDKNSRKKLAAENNIENYDFSAEKNIELLNKLKGLEKSVQNSDQNIDNVSKKEEPFNPVVNKKVQSNPVKPVINYPNISKDTPRNVANSTYVNHKNNYTLQTNSKPIKKEILDEGIDEIGNYYNYLINGLTRFYSKTAGDDGTTISKLPVKIQNNNTDTVKKVINPIITGDTLWDNKEQGIYHIPEVIDLKQTKFGYRNRGDNKTVDSDGYIFGSVDNKPVLESNNKNIKDNQVYIGFDDAGNVEANYGKNLKNSNKKLIPFNSFSDITGFAKDANNNYVLKSASNAAFNHSFPMLKNSNGELIGSPGTLIKNNNKNDVKKYGNITGGHMIISTPDFKKQILVSGSVDDLNNQLEKFKADNKINSVTVVQTDNGSFSRNFRTKNQKITSDQWKTFDRRNTRGGSGFYLKGKGYQIGGEIPNHLPNQLIMPNLQYRNNEIPMMNIGGFIPNHLPYNLPYELPMAANGLEMLNMGLGAMTMLNNQLQEKSNARIYNNTINRTGADSIFQNYNSETTRGFIDPNSGMTAPNRQTLTQFGNQQYNEYYGQPPIAADGLTFGLDSTGNMNVPIDPRIAQLTEFSNDNIPVDNSSSKTKEADFLTYMAHQQGEAGIKAIVKSANTGEHWSNFYKGENLDKNMEANVNKEEFYKKYSSITPTNFLDYWKNKFNRQSKKWSNKQTAYDPVIGELSQQFGFSPNFVKTVVGIESDFNPGAKTGSYKGLLQLSDKEAKANGASDVYNPIQNLMAGLKIMAKKRDNITKSILNKYKEGGEYDLSDLEIKHLKSLGYELEIS